MRTERRVLHGLAECPICHREPDVVISSGKKWRIFCETCDVSTPWSTKTEAVIRWFNLAAVVKEKLSELRTN